MASDLLEVLIAVGRLLIASIFLMAGWTKAREGRAFVTTVLKFEILPPALTAPFAMLLPWLEMSGAVLLFIGFSTRIAAVLVLLLSLMFASATLIAMHRRITLDCSCFGLLYRERIGKRTVVRDSLIAVIALAVALFDNGKLGWGAVVSGQADVPVVLVSVASIVLLSTSVVLAYRASRGFMARVAPETA